MGGVPAQSSRRAASNESIFDRLDTFSDVSNTLDTLVLLFPGHLTPIDHFGCPVFFWGEKKPQLQDLRIRTLNTCAGGENPVARV